MADYSSGNSKPTIGAVLPDKAIDAHRRQLEPLITPEQLKKRHLFGIDLVAPVRNRQTQQFDVMDDDLLKDIIDGAVSTAEAETHVDIFPVQRSEKFPFDQALFVQYGFLMLPHRPVVSIESLSVRPSNERDVYVVPLSWTESAFLHRGQVNIVPLTIALVNGGFIPTQASGGAAFLSILGNRSWLPAFWNVVYTTGFQDGMLPRIVNEYVGTIAAQEVLSQLAALHKASSTSLGIDGLSQGIGTPGPQVYVQRMQELDAKRKQICGKIRAYYGTKLFSATL